VVGNVGVYLVGGRLLITSNSRDINGVYVINGWLEVLSADAMDEALGRSIRTGLSETEDGVAAQPHDDPNRSRALAALVRAAGVHTYMAFVRAGTLAVDVWTTGDDRGIRITPMHNGGMRGRRRALTSCWSASVRCPSMRWTRRSAAPRARLFITRPSPGEFGSARAANCRPGA
jgi:hypothetical protein